MIKTSILNKDLNITDLICKSYIPGSSELSNSAHNVNAYSLHMHFDWYFRTAVSKPNTKWHVECYEK